MRMTLDQAFEFIFAESSGRPRVKMARAKRTMRKATSGAPEVMAKITGFTKADQSTRSHIEYITRNDKLEALDRYDSVLNKEEITDKRMSFDKINGRKAMKMVLSMPPDTEIEAFKKSVSQTLQREFGEHDYMYVFHEDTDHPHSHIVVPMVNDLGKRINPRKNDIQRYRQTFAEELEKNGVIACATTTQQRKVGMLSKVFGKEANRKEASASTKEKVDLAWKHIKQAYIKAGDADAVKLVNQLAPRRERQKSKGIELGE